MPSAPKRPCPEAGCSELTSGGRCGKHKRPVVEKVYEQERGSAASRGYGRKWRQASAQFLLEHPLCQCDECQDGRLRVRASEVTDHRVPHRGNMRLFWDRTNWQAMAKECHDKKTATQDGGFGHRSRAIVDGGGAGQFPKP